MKKDNWIWKMMVILGSAGVIFMALVSFSGTFINNHYVLNYFVTLGISLLVSGGCFCLGALMGFLFGIPRIINSNSVQEMRSTVLQNDNLVQISDWLTKILVGVGLTQIYQIPAFFKQIGDFLAPCFNVGNIGSAIAINLVLYFLILGFMACYLWTRFYFSEMLQDIVDDDPDLQENNVVTVHQMTVNAPDAPTQDPAAVSPAVTNPAPAGNPDNPGNQQSANIPASPPNPLVSPSDPPANQDNPVVNPG